MSVIVHFRGPLREARDELKVSTGDTTRKSGSEREKERKMWWRKQGVEVCGGNCTKTLSDIAKIQTNSYFGRTKMARVQQMPSWVCCIAAIHDLWWHVLWIYHGLVLARLSRLSFVALPAKAKGGRRWHIAPH